MRPIEPGCMAVVVTPENPNNNGKIVRVLRKHGPDGCQVTPIFFAAAGRGAVWEIDTPLDWPKTGLCLPYSTERGLHRIDEDWGKTTQWDESIWTPHKQGVTA